MSHKFRQNETLSMVGFTADNSAVALAVRFELLKNWVKKMLNGACDLQDSHFTPHNIYLNSSKINTASKHLEQIFIHSEKIIFF